MDKYTILKSIFGYEAYRPGQELLIDGVLAGRDVFGIMPTGGGKSMCYQIPAMLLPGITLVVSPLISLMRDQVMALKGAGVPAAYINSTLNAAQMRLVYRNLLRGMYKIVYVAPERLDYPGFGSVAEQLNISFLAVDEAHCISQWGQDFRPSYLRVVNFVEGLPRRPVVGAFTATATAQVQKDILRILKLRDPVSAVTGFDRPNLYFDVLSPESKDQALSKLLAQRPGKSGIVYCSTRRKVETVCEHLQNLGYGATRYHAGLEEQERMENQEDFQYDRKPIMVATNAFGMGIDKSNVSFVIHYNMPKSIEAYYQEAGRAGRDGSDADCILLYSPGDVHTAKFLIQNGSDNEELDPRQQERIRQQDMKRLEAMVGYCKTTTCLRGYILDYFGQKHPEICGSCGNCQGTYTLVDITREAVAILTCVQKIHGFLGRDVGLNLLGNVLRGSRNKQAQQMGLDSLPVYGCLQGRSRSDIHAMIGQLEADGCLVTTLESGTIGLTASAYEVLHHGRQVMQRVEVQTQQPTTSQLSPEAGDLLDVLKAHRYQIAKENSIPAYMVFSNATLEEMAKQRPTTLSQFKKISGVGTIKSAWYGESFTACIRNYLQEKS